MVKTTRTSYRPWSAIFSVIVYFTARVQKFGVWLVFLVFAGENFPDDCLRLDFRFPAGEPIRRREGACSPTCTCSPILRQSEDVNRFCQPHSQFPKSFFICADSERSESLFLTSQSSLKIFTQKSLSTPVSPQVASTINDEKYMNIVEIQEFSLSNFSCPCIYDSKKYIVLSWCRS